jgi:hypothetical protein
MCLAKFLSLVLLRRASWPGFALAGEVPLDFDASVGRGWPGGHFLSFASPKERKQRKGEPTVCVPQQSCRQPAVLASGRVSLELGYRLKQSRALIPLNLRSSAQTEGRLAAQLSLSNPLAVLRATLLCAVGRRCRQIVPNRRLSKSARAKQSVAGFAAVEAGLSSAGAGGSGLALFERSEFSQTPPAASSARNRAAARTSARFFFGYLLLARQKKVTRPPGRDPACHDHHSPERDQACLSHTARGVFLPTQQRELT